MNVLDLLIALPLLYGAWKGFRKGFLFEVAMILGLVVGVYLGFRFSDFAFRILQDLLHDEGYLLHILSFLIVTTIVVLVFIFYARLMESVLKITSLNIFNKIAGATIGVLKFALALSVIFWLLLPLDRLARVVPEKAKKESILYPYIMEIAAALAPAASEMTDAFRENFGRK